MTTEKPIVCILANSTLQNKAPAHAVKNQYIVPLIEIADAVPLLIPAIGENFSLKSIASRIDGILLTGSPSHTDPRLYGGKRAFEEELLDTARDATSQPLLREALALDIPTFAICRGFQEMNVAFGGTLHQFVYKLPGKLDHRESEKRHISGAGATQYEVQAHNIRRQPGGLFEKLGVPQKFMTNSLHTQGVDKIGDGLFIEGICEDGLVEAFSVPDKRFFLGTQWHPEGDFHLNPVSKMLFEAFARAVRGE